MLMSPSEVQVATATPAPPGPVCQTPAHSLVGEALGEPPVPGEGAAQVRPCRATWQVAEMRQRRPAITEGN